MQLVDVRSSGDKCLACFVAFVLDKVLDKAACKVDGFGVPIFHICVGVARIEDSAVHTGQLCRNGEVEVRDSLGGCGVDCAAQDCHAGWQS